MSESEAKEALLVLLQSAVAAAVEGKRPLTLLRGVALFDGERDRHLTDMPTFHQAMAQLVALPNFAERIGVQAGERISLQFVYEYFERVQELSFDQVTFDALWSDFLGELQNPVWTTRGIANVTHFTSPALDIQLGDGVSVRGRNFDELAALGFSVEILNRLKEDWTQPGASSFVLIAEYSELKTPKNLITIDAATPWTKAMRAVGALRLIGSGDVGIGSMWIAHPARFNPGVGGIGRVGVSLPNWGKQYEWTPEIAGAYPPVYSALAHLEQVGYSNGAGNLDLALRSFMATYDRWPAGNESRLLDAVTSLEAILGAENEISFKLAFRVASILAAGDDERSELMKLVKGFYDTRSKLVHGVSLKPKQKDLIARVDELRSLLRRLLRSLVILAIDGSSPFGHSFFAAELDSALVNGATREQLRKAMALA